VCDLPRIFWGSVAGTFSRGDIFDIKKGIVFGLLARAQFWFEVWPQGSGIPDF